MKLLSLLLCGCAMGVFLAASLSAAVQPHPTRAGRLVDERDGLRVEYSPGQEAFADAVFAPLAAWRQEFAEKEAQILATEPVVLPGSAKDLIAHREEILTAVAKKIGLPAPTALQGRVFDTMVGYYEMVEVMMDLQPVMSLSMRRCREAQIWTKTELSQRLVAGEKIEGFSWMPETQMIEYQIRMPESEFSVIQEADAQKFEAARLEHSFNYRPGADGVVNLAATFNLGKTMPPQALQPANRAVRWDESSRKMREFFRELRDTSWPIVLKAEDAGKVPDTVAREFVERLRAPFGQANTHGYRNPVLLHLILHEVAEVGLVENYIGSADRRWLCDGMANYVSWKLVRDRCGAEFAQQSYDLDAQLARHSAQWTQIDLRKWRAAENTKEEENGTPVMSAHYAFATRVVFEMVRQHGEAVVPKLFQEVAKTPRKKVRMETVEKAYRKLTGKKLKDLIRAAETTPVPGS